MTSLKQQNEILVSSQQQNEILVSSLSPHANQQAQCSAQALNCDNDDAVG
jgi:hypothetical protein